MILKTTYYTITEITNTEITTNYFCILLGFLVAFFICHLLVWLIILNDFYHLNGKKFQNSVV